MFTKYQINYKKTEPALVVYVVRSETKNHTNIFNGLSHI